MKDIKVIMATTSFTSVLNKVLNRSILEKIIFLCFFVFTCLLAILNLRNNPRSWMDEGSTLLLARTLAENGIYAIRNSDGYLTFGAVQSVGPTVILPIALSFKIFGVGLVQGRLVMAFYLIMTVFVFYKLASKLFNSSTAFFSSITLLSSKAASLLHYGRQALGEVPALGLFLCGCWIWSNSVAAKKGLRFKDAVFVGLLFGLAIITKSQYLIFCIAALGAIAILDILYFRQGYFKWVLLVSLTVLLSILLWWLWQLNYFGLQTFQENIEKLGELARNTSGFDLQTSKESIRFIIGNDSGYFTYFWGFAALVYGILVSLGRSQRNLIIPFLTLVMIFCVSYFIAWSIPWPPYFLPAASISALFIGKLWGDLFESSIVSWRLRNSQSLSRVISPLTISFVLVAATGYSFIGILRQDVLYTDNSNSMIASYLNENVGYDEIIETWEIELGIITRHQYHFPDQSMLAQTQSMLHRNTSYNYLLSGEYFDEHKVDYLVLGWSARQMNLYDMDYLGNRTCLIKTVGEGFWRYDVYKFLKDNDVSCKKN